MSPSYIVKDNYRFYADPSMNSYGVGIVSATTSHPSYSKPDQKNPLIHKELILIELRVTRERSVSIALWGEPTGNQTKARTCMKSQYISVIFEKKDFFKKISKQLLNQPHKNNK